MAKLNDARRALQRAKDSAKKRLEQIDHERRELKASLKSLDAAMRALEGPRGSREEAERSVGRTLDEPSRTASDAGADSLEGHLNE